MTDTDPSKAMNALIRGKAGHSDEQAKQDDEDKEQPVPSFDGGARSTPPKDMNWLIRHGADR
jgi:hypothetical protein